MKFAYTIVYVASVRDTLAFYEKAFGFQTRFLHEGGDYGELNTGSTTLAFASHGLGDANLSAGYIRADASAQPLGVELAFATDDVATAYQRALQAGAKDIAPPKLKPWGQTVAYVRSPEGSLIELCTPVGAA
jgi:lactoylglutathione lyase